MLRIEQLKRLSPAVMGNVRLELLADNHASGVFSVRSDKEIMRWVDAGLMDSEDDALSWIKAFRQSPNSCRWAIVQNSDQAVMGTIGFYHIDEKHGIASLGFELASPYHGKGYMKSAIFCLCRPVIERNILNRIEAQVHEANTGSQHLLLKCGFQKEGLLRSNFLVENELGNSWMFSFIRADI